MRRDPYLVAVSDLRGCAPLSFFSSCREERTRPRREASPFRDARIQKEKIAKRGIPCRLSRLCTRGCPTRFGAGLSSIPFRASFRGRLAALAPLDTLGSDGHTVGADALGGPAVWFAIPHAPRRTCTISRPHRRGDSPMKGAMHESPARNSLKSSNTPGESVRLPGRHASLW